MTLSDNKIRIVDLADNADVTGADFGWLVVEYDSSSEQVRALLLDQSDGLGAPVAQSDPIASSSLPATLTLNEVGGSGVTASVTVDGVRT